MSPVLSQPSRSTSAVSSGRFQYPAMRECERTWISPCSPAGSPAPSAERTVTSTPGRGRPTESCPPSPVRPCSCGARTAMFCASDIP